MFIKHTLGKDFIVPIKSNRKVALSLADKLQGRYVQVETLALEANVTPTIYLEGVDLAPRQASLRKRRWPYRHASRVSGDQRYHPFRRRHHHHLSETVERGAVPQIAEAKCVVGKITDPDCHDSDESFLCRLVSVHQTGNAERDNQAEPLRLENETVCERASSGVFNLAGTTACSTHCVR